MKQIQYFIVRLTQVLCTGTRVSQYFSLEKICLPRKSTVPRIRSNFWRLWFHQKYLIFFLGRLLPILHRFWQNPRIWDRRIVCLLGRLTKNDTRRSQKNLNEMKWVGEEDSSRVRLFFLDLFLIFTTFSDYENNILGSEILKETGIPRYPVLKHEKLYQIR